MKLTTLIFYYFVFTILLAVAEARTCSIIVYSPFKTSASIIFLTYLNNNVTYRDNNINSRNNNVIWRHAYINILNTDDSKVTWLVTWPDIILGTNPLLSSFWLAPESMKFSIWSGWKFPVRRAPIQLRSDVRRYVSSLQPFCSKDRSNPVQYRWAVIGSRIRCSILFSFLISFFLVLFSLQFNFNFLSDVK